MKKKHKSRPLVLGSYFAFVASKDKYLERIASQAFEEFPRQDRTGSYEY